jgi:hypothetical protein
MWDTGLRLDTLYGEIGLFLDRGLNGGVLRIRERKSKRSVQLRKYIASKGMYGMELVFQNPDECEDYLERMRNYCTRTQTPSQVEARRDTDGGALIRIDCGKDVDQAHRLLVVFLVDVLGLPANSRFDIETENVSPWMEVIDSPDQKPAAEADRLRLFDEWSKRRSGVSVVSTTVLALVGICQIFGILALLTTLIFQQDDWSGVSISFAGIIIKIPWAGLISALFIMIGFLAICTDLFWRKPRIGGGLALDPIPKSVGGALRIFRHRPIYWVSVAILAIAFYTWTSV